MLTKYYRSGLQIFLFLGIYGILHSLYFGLPNEVLREVIYHRGVCELCSGLINWLFPLEQVSAVHNHLLSPRADLEIVRGCDGAGVLFMLIAAIIAFPADIKRKLTGLLCGVVLIYSLNLLRISGLYFVVAYNQDWFTIIHTYLAPTLMIILTCLYFAWWTLGSVKTSYESE